MVITQFSKNKPKKPITSKKYDYIGKWNYSIRKSPFFKIKTQRKKWRVLVNKAGETFLQEQIS